VRAWRLPASLAELLNDVTARSNAANALKEDAKTNAAA
jgi:hypothetical protein